MSNFVGLNAQLVISSAFVVAYIRMTTTAIQLTLVYITVGFVKMIPRHAAHRTFPSP
jgi:hypothetical protein